MVSQLGIPSQPTPPNHENTQSLKPATSKVYSKLNLGQIAPQSRILLQQKSRGPPEVAENLNPLHMYTLTPSSIHTENRIKNLHNDNCKK